MVSITALILLSAAATVKDCAPGRSAFKVNELYLSPIILHGGDPFNLYVNYTVPDIIYSGRVTYATTYNFFPMSPVSMPLCEFTECPIYPGNYANKSTHTWPSGVVDSVHTQMSWFDDNNAILLCMEINGKALW